MELKAHVQTPFIRLKTGEAVALGLCQGKVGRRGLDSDGEGWRRCFAPLYSGEKSPGKSSVSQSSLGVPMGQT